MQEFLLILRGDGMNHLSPDELQNIMADYKTWVDNIFKEEGSSIIDLRDQLSENQKNISANLEKIKVGQQVDNFVTVSRELIFKLGRYDYQTAIVPLLQFEEFQQEYISRKNELTKFDQDSAIALQTRLSFYTELLYKSINSDSIISDLNTKALDTEKLQRHREFLDKYFGGIEDENFTLATIEINQVEAMTPHQKEPEFIDIS